MISGNPTTRKVTRKVTITLPAAALEAVRQLVDAGWGALLSEALSVGWSARSRS